MEKTLNYKNTNNKVILCSSLGNALECYDFALYAYLLPIISKAFFPTFSFVASLGAYALSFLFRPLGGIIFGYVGDVWGRKTSLTLSIFLMAIATGTMGITPTYEQFGIVSSIIIVLARIMQGLCIGGETSGAVILALEHHKEENFLKVGSLISSSSFVGFFLAAAVLGILSSEWFPPEFWRGAFLIGSLIGFVGVYMRVSLLESPEFEKIFNAKKIERCPALRIIKEHKASLLIAMSLTALYGTTGTFSTVYMNILLTTEFGYSISESPIVVGFGLLVHAFVCFCTSFVKTVNKELNIILFSCFSYAFVIYFLLSLIGNKSFTLILISQCIVCSLSALLWAASNSYSYRLFPVNVRHSGMALGESLGRAIFVGFSPIVILELQHISTFAVSAFLMFLCFQFIGIVGYFIPNSLFNNKRNKLETA